MISKGSAEDSFFVFRATVEDTDRAFHDLKRDMNPQFVHVFLDKIQRYAKKPDRALFLAGQENRIVGFSTIIDTSPPPEGFAEESFLQQYACGTGLMVLPEYRKKGIGSWFLREWEHFAAEIGAAGLWLVTRQMADWYQSRFNYELLGQTVSKGVEKSVLVKHL